MAFDSIIKVFLDFGSNANGVLDGITSKVDSVGQKVISVGQGFLPFSLGAAAALGGAVKLAADFDKALQAAARGLDLSEKEVTAFAKSMENLQKELKYQFTSTELANIATEAGKLGVAKEDIDDFTKTVTKLAVAVDKTDKIDELSTNMAKIQAVFRMSTSDLEKFGAAMNRLSDSSSATADQITIFTQMAGKVGAAFGVHQNELAAYGTTLISAGAKAGEAATFMNKFLTVLAAPTNSSKIAQESIEKLGFSVSDLAERFDKDASSTMEDFLRRLNSLDNITKRDVMGRIFGLEHIDNASLLTAQVDNLQKFLHMAGESETNIAKLNNEFSKMAENSFEGQYKTFVNMVGELGKQIGMVLLPGINSILKGLQPILSKIVDFVQLYPGVSKYIAFAGLLVTALAPLTIAIGSVINSVGTLIAFGSSASAVIKGVASLAAWALPVMSAGFMAVASSVVTAVAPFAPFIAAGVAVGALAAIIIRNWTPISGFFQNLFKGAINVISSFYNGSKQIFSNLSQWVISSFSGMVANAKYYGQMLIYSFIQGVQSYAQSLVNSVSNLMQTVRGYLPSSPSKYGALSDLDKTGAAFTETFLQGVKNSPLSGFLDNVFTTPQVPNNSPISIPGASGNGVSINVELNYNPQITGSKIDAQVILDLLKNDERNLQNLLQDAVSKIDRRFYI